MMICFDDRLTLFIRILLANSNSLLDFSDIGFQFYESNHEEKQRNSSNKNEIAEIRTSTSAAERSIFIPTFKVPPPPYLPLIVSSKFYKIHSAAVCGSEFATDGNESLLHGIR